MFTILDQSITQKSSIPITIIKSRWKAEVMQQMKDHFLYYASVHKLPVFPLCSPSYHKRASKHDATCSRPGKVPLLKKWQYATVPDEAQIDKWMEKVPDCNIGLLLGGASGICGIDVDGSEGYRMLDEISHGDLPPTWQFPTPNGGMRYLYRIPPGLTLRKYTISGTSEHCECALLGEGQMTVLPPSILNNGSYEWEDGRSPDEIELAEAPGWMVQLMTNSPRSSASTTVKKSPLDLLAGSCPRFANDLQIQKGIGLHEEDWFLWSTLLVNAGCINEALEFSRASSKHNSGSESRIQMIRPMGMVRCRTFGCAEEQIRKCFQGKLRVNDKGEVTNSPGAFIQKQDSIRLEREDLEQIGFSFDKNDQITGLNGNLFAAHILKHHDLLYSEGDRFYHWDHGVWKYMDMNNLSRILRDFLHQYAPNFWTVKREEQYLEALKREAPRVDELNANRKYINLENGMLNLETFQLVPHNKALYSSIRVPIRYDPKAECPTFMKFLNDVFECDEERIKLTAEILGYCLTAETKAQKAFIFYGKGSNGKSVLADVVVQLSGKENCSAVPLQELDRSFARYDLVGKLINVSTENEVGSGELNTQYFKAIVSGEPIRVEIKHGGSFMYKAICKLLFALNNLPYSKDKSHGFLRRLVILPFNKTFGSKDADVHLPEKLKAELPGILNFALEGLKRLRKNKYQFTQSSAVDQAVQEYADTLNPVRIFADDMIEAGESHDSISYKDLRSKFLSWADQSGYASNYSEIKFADNLKGVLKEKGIPFDLFKGSQGKRGLKGIRWKEPINDPFTSSSDNEEVDDIDDIATEGFTTKR